MKYVLDLHPYFSFELIRCVDYVGSYDFLSSDCLEVWNCNQSGQSVFVSQSQNLTLFLLQFQEDLHMCGC